MQDQTQVVEPEWLICPLTRVMFREPVVNLIGHTYEFEMYQRALRQRMVDPLTNQPLPAPHGGPLHPNRAVREAIQAFLEENPGYHPEGWPAGPPPPAPSAMQLASDGGFNMWDFVQGKQFQSLQGFARCASLTFGFLFRHLSSLLPEYDPQHEASKHIGHAGGVLGIAAGLSCGRIGWLMAVRLMRALAGNTPLIPFELLASPRYGMDEWAMRVHHLVPTLPIQWCPLVVARVMLERYWIFRHAVSEMIWDRIFQRVLSISRMCRNDVMGISSFLGEASQDNDWLSGTSYTMPLALTACIHFVIIGREVGQKCAAKRFDEYARFADLRQAERRRWKQTKAILSALWSAWFAGFSIVPFFGVMYGVSSLLARALTFSFRAWLLALRLRREARVRSMTLGAGTV